MNEEPATLENRPLGMAAVAMLLFALGGVGTWAQEYWAWVPRRLTDLLQLTGLALSLGALAWSARMLFSSPPPNRRLLRLLAGAIGLAAVPPLIFLAWWLWLHAALATPVLVFHTL